MGSAQCGHVRVFVEIDKAVTPSKGAIYFTPLTCGPLFNFAHSDQLPRLLDGGQCRRACHRARIRATRWPLAMTTKMNTRSRSRRAFARRQVVSAGTARLRTMLLLVRIGSLETRGHDGRWLTWFGEIRSPARRVESQRIWRARRTSDKPRALRDVSKRLIQAIGRCRPFLLK